MKNDLEDKFILLVIGIVIVSAIGGYLSIPPGVIDSINKLIIGLFVGAVTSFLAGTIVEGFTGNFLKPFALNIEILGISFSITAFAIATFLVETWLFGI